MLRNVARPVRRGVVAKVPIGNSVATYPTNPVYDVPCTRNTGLPKGGDPQGHGVAGVLSDGENPLQGEGRQVDECLEEQWGGARDAAVEPE